ncbi:MAG TPA: zinc ribbon domain-containing protein [Bacteroidota bacterium]
MPTYDYKCKECGHSFEEFQSISANPLVKCPQCGKDGLRRMLDGGAGMIFKGQGFYQTDYKRSGAGGGSKKEASSDKTAPAAPKKDESKPSGESAKKES